LKTRCFIAGAGEYTGIVTPGQSDYVIAADGGYATLASLGIEPDLVVGDFDSLGAPPDHPNVIRSPVEKDDTDMMLAVRHGLDMGIKSFLIDGGLDGRLDHTIANIQILAHLAQNGAHGVLLGREMCVTAVTNGSVLFAPEQPAPEQPAPDRTALELFAPDSTAPEATAPDSTAPICIVTGDALIGTVSVFCFGDRAEGVTLTGLKYPLDNTTLVCDYPLGVSNEFTGGPASVAVRNGTLIITFCRGELRSPARTIDRPFVGAATCRQQSTTTNNPTDRSEKGGIC